MLLSVSPCNATRGHCVGRCVCVCVSGLTEAHSPMPPNSTTEHLDLTQTGLFANKNTPSPELDLHFFFLLVIVCFLLPFSLSSQPHLILWLVCSRNIPGPFAGKLEGYLKLRGKFGDFSSREPRGKIDWQGYLLQCLFCPPNFFPSLLAFSWSVYPSIYSSQARYTCIPAACRRRFHWKW